MKTLLIIGAGLGISHSTAQRFAKEGFRIILAGRDQQNAAGLVDTLRQQGTEVSYHSLDATNVEQLNQLIDALEAEYGQLDVVHYNAGNVRHQTIEEQPAESFIADLNVNIAGAMVAAKRAFSFMKKRQAGTILLTGGGFALQPHPEFLSISIGKAGIRALTQGLFDAFKAENVHIATVTVAGFISPATKEADAVAEHLWQLHQQERADWTEEVIYTP